MPFEQAQLGIYYIVEINHSILYCSAAQQPHTQIRKIFPFAIMLGTYSGRGVKKAQPPRPPDVSRPLN